MTRRILGVFLALVLAILGTAAVLFYVNSARNSVAAGQTAVTVLVAKERIPAGTSGASLKARGLFDEIVMPAATVPEDSLADLPTILDDLVLTHDVQARQLLMEGMFGSPTRLSGGIAVPDEMMAVSLKMAVEEEVGGFVRPGSQIAVFGTFKLVDEEFKELTGDDNRLTKLLLERVEVLAVGAYGRDGVTSAQSDQDDEGQAGGSVTLLVTVAVAQADAERLIHAVRNGELYLALLTDTSEVGPGPGVSNLTLLSD